jgi:3-deoxy-D-manno-octulosonic-acid transferase
MLSYTLYDLVGSLLGLLLLPVVPALLLTRYRRGLSQRLGRLPPPAVALRHPVWIHAASVGEVLAAEPLVRELRRHDPGLPILVSTTTVTGRETARTQLPADAVTLAPLDVCWIVNRVMRRIAPRCLVLVETELWPALLRAASSHGVPSVLVSGCISARSTARYARVGWLARAVLPQIRTFAMQTPADVERIVSLGAPAERVHVVGNLKFARGVVAAGGAPAPGAALVAGRRLLIAASTHAGEEQLVLDACGALWADHPDVLLLLAPRRPERFDEVAALVDRRGLVCARRSRTPGPLALTTQVLLLDTLGELPGFFPAATAVFVGGTTVPVEGHNVLEPAVYGKPVAFGPRVANVRDAAEALLAAGAAVVVPDAAALRREWERVLTDAEAGPRMGAHGRAVVDSRAAVAAHTADLVRRCWTTR